MSSVFVFTARSARVNINKKVLSERIQVGVISLTVILAIMIAAVLMIYLMASNTSATKGYDIKNLNAQQQSLRRTSEDLDIYISQRSSLSAVTSNPMTTNLVVAKASEMVFANPSTTAMAKK